MRRPFALACTAQTGLALTGLALASLGGCALGPPTRAPDLRLPAAYEAPKTEAAADPASLAQWWSLYDDPQLQALIEEALTHAPDAEIAAARLVEARAVRASALSAYDPQGEIQGSASRNQTGVVSGVSSVNFGGYQVPLITTTPIDTYSAQFDVSWEIDLFGRRRAARKKAEADLAAARFDYAATRTSLAANVADSLFQARGLAIQLDDARESARIQHELADVAEKKFIHGLGARADADQAAAQDAQAQAEIEDLQSQLHAARRSLLVLVGRGADPLDSLPTPAVAGTPPPAPVSVPAALLASRPDVREAAQQLISASGQFKLDELALFPTFTLQPGVGLSSSVELGAATTTDMWQVGVGLVQPVLNLPQLEDEIHAQGARVDQAALTYQKTVQTAYSEAENALVELASDEARVRLLTDGEARARAALDSERKGYAAGVVSLTDVLTAETTWRSARTELTSAQIQALRRSVQAFKALGGGWTPPGPMKQATR